MFTIYLLLFFNKLGKISICLPFLALCAFLLYSCSLCLLPAASALPVRSTNSGAELVGNMN